MIIKTRITTFYNTVILTSNAKVWAQAEFNDFERAQYS